MNNKTKVVLGLAAMVAGTVGVGTTATFAWFTTQNTATLSFGNAHVVSDNASILVQYEAIANSGIDDTLVTAGKDTAGSAVTIAGAAIDCRDISGDGSTFYRPHWTTFNVTADRMDPAVNGSNKHYYVTFGVAVTNKGAANTKVFIGKNSAVSAASTPSADIEAAKGTRVSIREGATTATATNLKTIWQYDTTDGTANTAYKYLAAVDGDTAYGLANYKLANPASDTFFAGPYTTDATYANTDAGRLVTTFTTQNETRHLVISMWIEGTVGASDDDCIGGNVKFSLILDAQTNA
jgi:hypothetical protein